MKEFKIMEQTEKNALILNKIKSSTDFIWLENELIKKTNFNQVILTEIVKIPSLKIKNLLKKNYNI